MMCADFLTLREELDILAEFNIEWLHVDIMDGHYVPNFTLGIDYSKALAGYSNIPLDFHLMVEEPDRFVPVFCQIKNSRFSFHPETSRHPVGTIQLIERFDCKPSIAIDPAMPVSAVKHLLPLVDQVCVMTVNPGYAGQKLIPFCLDKIHELSLLKKENGYTYEIEVDGNVSWENIPKMVNAGAEILVVGTSSVFTKEVPRREAFQKLRDLIHSLDQTIA